VAAQRCPDSCAHSKAVQALTIEKLSVFDDSMTQRTNPHVPFRRLSNAQYATCFMMTSSHALMSASQLNEKRYLQRQQHAAHEKVNPQRPQKQQQQQQQQQQ